ncbi:MAG: hypothetical protein ACI37Q_07440 [Candidatus Gastranaerophilaceae bacterium]
MTRDYLPPLPPGMQPPPPGQMPPPPPPMGAPGNGNFMQAGFSQYYHPGVSGANPDEMAVAAYDAEHGKGAAQKAGMDTVRAWMKEKCGGDPGTGTLPSKITPSTETIGTSSGSTTTAVSSTTIATTAADVSGNMVTKTYSKKEIKTIQKQMERWSSEYRKTYKNEYKAKYPDKHIREQYMNIDAKEYALQMWNTLHPNETCPVNSFKY